MEEVNVSSFLACSLLLGCTSLASAQPAVPSQGQQILRACANTYRSLREFKGGAAVIDQSSIGGQIIFNNADASFDFKRDQHFNISGYDSSHDKYSINSTPQKTTTKWAIMNEGKEQTQPDLSLAIAGFTGVAALAPTYVPSLLVDMHYRLPFDVDADTTLKPNEMFGGHDCFVISQKVAKYSETDTYWVDTKTFLLRGIQQEQGNHSLDIPAVQDGQGNTIPAIKTTIGFSSRLHVFSIERTLPSEAELEATAKPTLDKIQPQLTLAGKLEQGFYAESTVRYDVNVRR